VIKELKDSIYYSKNGQVCLLYNNGILSKEDNITESISKIVFIGHDKHKS
jgi:hypothetical protein